MREAAARGPSIDIAELERRLRDPQAETSGDDPFEELERMLYGGQVATTGDRSGERPTDEAETTPASPDQEREARESEPIDSTDVAAFDEPPIEQAYAPHMRRHAENLRRLQEQSADHLDLRTREDEFRGQEQEDEHEAAPPRREALGGARMLKSAAAGVAALALIGIGLALASHGDAAFRTVASVAGASLQVRDEGTDRDVAAAPRNEIASAPGDTAQEEPPADAPQALSAVDARPAEAPARPSSEFAVTPLKVKSVPIRPAGADDGVASSAGSDRPDQAIEAASADAAPVIEAEDPPATRPHAGRRAGGKFADDASALETEAEPSSGRGGTFEVRFGSAKTAMEARRLMNQTADKFGSQLGGRTLGYRHARVGGKTVYVVRLRSRLDRKSADGVCEKVKSIGEDCVVAAM